MICLPIIFNLHVIIEKFNDDWEIISEISLLLIETHFKEEDG
jgi:hypothetical protein